MTLALGGLSATDVAAVEEQMCGSYQSRVTLGLVDFAHRPVSDDVVLDRVSGSVQVKASPDGVTRSLSLAVADLGDVLGLGNGSRAVSPKSMLWVSKGLYVDRLSRWVDIPVFMGPITKPDRADDMLTIEAQDKAVFSLEHRSTYTIKAGTNAASAMRDVLTKVVGESRFRIAPTSKKLLRPHTLSPENTPWQFIQKVAKSLGWVAFYDAEGYFVAKPRPTEPVFDFRTGRRPTDSLTSRVKAGYWTEQTKNRVVVTGKVVAGVAVQAIASLPASHPLSARTLAVGPNAVSWDKTEYVEDTDLGTTAECREVAEERLAQLAVQQTTAEFESMSPWHLQEYDAYTVQAQYGVMTAWVDETTIPLGAEAQSFGFLKPTAKPSAFSTKTNSKKVQSAKRKRSRR